MTITSEVQAVHAHEGHDAHEGHGGHEGHHGHGDHAELFRRRFWWSLLLTLPIVATSEMVMDWLGYELEVPGQALIGPVLGSIVFWWAGWPFLSGAADELRARRPGMMLLV